jgi:hypothetical protein
VHQYDDLPPQYRANIDVVDAPLDRKRGQAPALNDAEIADVLAFLNTLTDGYRPGGSTGEHSGTQAGAQAGPKAGTRPYAQTAAASPSARPTASQ